MRNSRIASTLILFGLLFLQSCDGNHDQFVGVKEIARIHDPTVDKDITLLEVSTFSSITYNIYIFDNHTDTSTFSSTWDPVMVAIVGTKDQPPQLIRSDGCYIAVTALKIADGAKHQVAFPQGALCFSTRLP